MRSAASLASPALKPPAAPNVRYPVAARSLRSPLSVDRV